MTDIKPRSELKLRRKQHPHLTQTETPIEAATYQVDSELTAPLVQFDKIALETAYDECREIIKRGSKTFYLGSRFLPYEKRRAMWAVYSFCRFTDDMVDNAGSMPPDELAAKVDNWQAELNRTFQQLAPPSLPHLLAWQHTCATFAVPQTAALELIEGVRMDLNKSRYENFDELWLYCYRVASTVGLMTAPIIGYEGGEKTLQYAIDLGVAKQLTNILRDVGEDARNGRIYIPLDEMRQFNYTEEELFRGEVNERFVALMKFQIERARSYYEQAIPGIERLHKDGRLAITLAARFYSRILDVIERNNYDVFTRRAYVPTSEKLRMIGGIWAKRTFKKG